MLKELLEDFLKLATISITVTLCWKILEHFILGQIIPNRVDNIICKDDNDNYSLTTISDMDIQHKAISRKLYDLLKKEFVNQDTL